MIVNLNTHAATCFRARFWPDCVVQCKTCWATKLDAFVAPHESLWTFYIQCFLLLFFIDVHVSVLSNYPSKFNGVNSIKKKSHNLMLHILKFEIYNKIIFTRWWCLLNRHNDPKKCYSSGKKFLDMPCICELLHLESLWSLLMRFVFSKGNSHCTKTNWRLENKDWRSLISLFLVALIYFTPQTSHWAFPTPWDLTYLQKLHCNCEYVWLGWVGALRWFHKS